MVKVAFDKYRRRSRRRSPAECGLVAMALLVMNAADHAYALGDHGNGPGLGRGRLHSGGRVVKARQDGPSASVVVPAAKTWTVHRPAARRASAALVIRCQGGQIGIYVTFPDRVWGGEAIVRYKLKDRQRSVEPRSKGQPARGPARGMERLGGAELVREILGADVLDVVIDDVGLGLSEAVFILGSAKGAVQRVEQACRKGEGQASAGVPPRQVPAAISSARRARQPGPAEQQESPRQPEDRRDQAARNQTPAREQRAEDEDRHSPRALEEIPQPSPQPPEDPPPGPSEPAPEQAERPAMEPDDRSGAAPEPPASPLEQAPVPVTPRQDTAPQPEAAEVEPPLPSAHPALPSANQETSAATPPPLPADPPRPDTADRNARLAAYIERYGPNRKGELIYGWYYQCLARAGIDRDQVWYLSDPELTYLSRGERDRVRLSLLVSITQDADAPPRRVTCHGIARGRDLVIERTD